MKTVNIQQAKTQLSRLVEEAAAGETVIVTKNGKPRAVISALKLDPRRRRLGGWSGKARFLSDDFDAEDPRIVEWFNSDRPA